eukprot:scaffold8670_cov127-Isochrysis_galbana.AAC.2
MGRGSQVGGGRGEEGDWRKHRSRLGEHPPCPLIPKPPPQPPHLFTCILSVLCSPPRRPKRVGATARWR